MNNTKVVPMNVIGVILRTSGATYRNSCKAHVFHRSRRVQRVLDHLPTPYTKYKPRCGRFGKQRFADPYHLLGPPGEADYILFAFRVCFSQNTKQSLYTFRISCEFRVQTISNIWFFVDDVNNDHSQ